MLAFESNGSIEWVMAHEFGSILYNAQYSCHAPGVRDGAAGRQWMFSGLAPSLIWQAFPQ